jgi:hypothetical protein
MEQDTGMSAGAQPRRPACPAAGVRRLGAQAPGALALAFALYCAPDRLRGEMRTPTSAVMKPTPAFPSPAHAAAPPCAL